MSLAGMQKVSINCLILQSLDHPGEVVLASVLVHDKGQEPSLFVASLGVCLSL